MQKGREAEIPASSRSDIRVPFCGYSKIESPCDYFIPNNLSRIAWGTMSTIPLQEFHYRIHQWSSVTSDGIKCVFKLTDSNHLSLSLFQKDRTIKSVKRIFVINKYTYICDVNSVYPINVTVFITVVPKPIYRHARSRTLHVHPSTIWKTRTCPTYGEWLIIWTTFLPQRRADNP